MTWLYLDDQFFDHPKVARAGGDASWLFLCGLGYVQRHGTEGVIPKEVVARLSDRKQPNKLALRLVEVRLWEDDGPVYRVHDWAEWNRTRASKSESGRKAATARWQSERNANASKPHSGGNARDMPIPNPIPNPEEQPPPTPPDVGDVLTQACQVLAEREADQRGSSITSRPGWVRARVKSLVREHADEAARVLEKMPDLPASALVRYLAGDRNVVPIRKWEPCGSCDGGWIELRDEHDELTGVAPCACRELA